MTVKELREFLNSIEPDYDDCSVVIFKDTKKIDVDSVCKICSPMGKSCCVEIRLEK